MSRKKILFISAFYPNPCEESIAPYNRQILSSLSDFYDIDAIVPVSWTKRMRLSIPSFVCKGRLNIHYPTYYYTPGILRNLYGAFYHFSIAKTVEKLVSENDYDLIYTSWLYPDAFVVEKIARQLKIPFYVLVLGTDVNRLKPDTYLATSALKVANSANKIICVCNVLKQKLISLGCSPHKLEYLQNGVDHKVFYRRDRDEVRRELGVNSESKVLLFVGNLLKEKGLSELVQSFSRIFVSGRSPDVRLVIIGGGRYRKKLLNLLAKCNVDSSTILLGRQPLDVISVWMNAADLLCLPSYSEGQPNVIIEALTCHTKVVASNVGGIPDLDDGGGNVKLVEPRSAEALTAALFETLDDDRPFNFNQVTYSWDDYVVKLKGLFEE